MTNTAGTYRPSLYELTGALLSLKYAEAKKPFPVRYFPKTVKVRSHTVIT